MGCPTGGGMPSIPGTVVQCGYNLGKKGEDSKTRRGAMKSRL